MRVVSIGSYDPQFNRNVLTDRLLEEINGVEHVSIPSHIFSGDRLTLWRNAKFATSFRVLPYLTGLFLRTLVDSLRHRGSTYLVRYPGYLDAPVVRLASLLGAGRVLYDPFVSIYDTVISDRGLASGNSWVAKALKLIDVVALRASHTVICDTPQSGDFLARLSKCPRAKFATLWIGADEDSYFPPNANERETERTKLLAKLNLDPSQRQFLVLYYGNFIPLHGVDRIIQAANQVPQDVHFILVGDGQERLQSEVSATRFLLKNVTFLERCSADDIRRLIWAVDLTLGTFGSSDKAQRVLPNKVMESMACAQLVLTGDTRTTQAWLDSVPFSNNSPADIAAAIKRLASADSLQQSRVAARNEYLEKFSTRVRCTQLRDLLCRFN